MKESAASIASAMVAIFLTGWIIIAHDLSPDFKQSLASLTGNHWISVSVIAIVLFILCLELLMGFKSARRFLRVYDISLWSTFLVVVTLIMVLGILAVLITQFLSH